MPYPSNSNLPANVKKLSSEAQTSWRKAFNNAYKTHSEEDSFAIAWSIVNRMEKEYIEHEVDILKSDDEKRLVYGVVLEPDTVDLHDHTISADEIEKTAHNYIDKYRVVGERHIKRADGTKVVESYIAPVNFEWNGQQVKKGSWLLVIKVFTDSLWDKIKMGTYNSYSIGGFATLEDKED